MREFPNPGYPPTKWPADTRIGIRFANGMVPKWTYTVRQLRWDRRGSDFDIATFWKD